MDMGLEYHDCKINTYTFAAGYLIDVVDFPFEEELKIYLHHEYYDGIKVHIFDIRKDELDCGGAGALEDIIEGQLISNNFIHEFQQKYFYINKGV